MKSKQHLMNYKRVPNWRVEINAGGLGLKLDLSTDEVQRVVGQVEVPGWSMEGRSGASETCDG